MSKVIKDAEAYLKLFIQTSSHFQRKALLDTITTDQVKALCEITHNLLQGNINVSDNKLRPLLKHQTFIRSLGNPKVSLKEKKKLVCCRAPILLKLLKVCQPTLGQIWTK